MTFTLHVSLERVEVRVSREDNEELAEPDELGDVLFECLVRPDYVEAKGVPLVQPDEVHIYNGDVFTDQMHGGQCENLHV